LNIAKEENVRFFIYCGSVSSVQGLTVVEGGTETTTPLPSKFNLLFRDYGDSKQRAQTLVLGEDGFQYDNGTLFI